jgi:hypothetical protein
MVAGGGRNCVTLISHSDLLSDPGAIDLGPVPARGMVHTWNGTGRGDSSGDQEQAGRRVPSRRQARE